MSLKVPSLFNLAVIYIERNIDKISRKPISSIITQSLLDYMLKRRRAGSKSLNDDNISWFFTYDINYLDLESIWITDKAFETFNCPNL